jgi:hypothetical protein
MSIASLATLNPESTARRRLWLLIGWTGALVLYVVLQFGMTERGSFRAAFLIDFAWTLAALVAAYQCTATANRFQGRERFAWLCFAGASLIWFLGQAYWDYLELWLKQQTPFPTAADLGYLGFPVLAVAGLLSSIRRVELRSGFLRPLSNLGMIAVALYTVLGMLMHDSVVGTSASLLAAFAGAAYPFLYGTAFLVALSALCRPGRSACSRSARPIGASACSARTICRARWPSRPGWWVLPCCIGRPGNARISRSNPNRCGHPNRRPSGSNRCCRWWR